MSGGPVESEHPTDGKEESAVAIPGADLLESRRAVLVIHGIGKQQRFQTLDAFVYGLRRVLPKTSVTHVRLRRGEVFEHFVRVEGTGSLDIYEFYWAPLVAGKASFGATVSWVLQTGFTPLRRLAFNLPLLIQRVRDSAMKDDESLSASLIRFFDVTPGHAISWIKYGVLALAFFLAELARVTGVLVASLVLAGLAAALAASSSSVATQLIAVIQRAKMRPPTSWESLSAVVFVMVLIAAATLLLSLPRQVRDWVRYVRASPEGVLRLSWFGILLYAVGVLQGIATRVRNAWRAATEGFSRVWSRTPKRQAGLSKPHTQPIPASGQGDTDRAIGTAQAGVTSEASPLEPLNDIVWRGFGRLGRFLGHAIATVAETIRHRFRLWRIELVGRALFLILSLVSLALLGWVLARLAAPTPVCLVQACLDPVVHRMVTELGPATLRDIGVIAGLASLGFYVKRGFVDYVTDIAIYTTTDENSPFAATRRDILDEAARRARWLLRHYESVTLAGHSLGSVIGYDLLSCLLAESRLNVEAPPQTDKVVQRVADLLAKVPPGDAPEAAALVLELRRNATKDPTTDAIEPGELSRLKTFVTFGSPLNKVLYFFRTRVQGYETLRAHILNELHGFRRAPDVLSLVSEISDAVMTSDGVRLDKEGNSEPLDSLYWLNVSAPLDPISGRIVSYQRIYEYRRWFLLPGLCHMSYWYDRRFYEEVLAAIGGRAQRAKLRVGFA